jgi:hypothetical protein
MAAARVNDGAIPSDDSTEGSTRDIGPAHRVF